MFMHDFIQPADTRMQLLAGMWTRIIGQAKNLGCAGQDPELPNVGQINLESEFPIHLRLRQTSKCVFLYTRKMH